MFQRHASQAFGRLRKAVSDEGRRREPRAALRLSKKYRGEGEGGRKQVPAPRNNHPPAGVNGVLQKASIYAETGKKRGFASIRREMRDTLHGPQGGQGCVAKSCFLQRTLLLHPGQRRYIPAADRRDAVCCLSVARQKRFKGIRKQQCGATCPALLFSYPKAWQPPAR